MMLKIKIYNQIFQNNQQKIKKKRKNLQTNNFYKALQVIQIFKQYPKKIHKMIVY